MRFKRVESRSCCCTSRLWGGVHSLSASSISTSLRRCCSFPAGCSSCSWCPVWCSSTTAVHELVWMAAAETVVLSCTLINAPRSSSRVRGCRKCWLKSPRVVDSDKISPALQYVALPVPLLWFLSVSNCRPSIDLLCGWSQMAPSYSWCLHIYSCWDSRMSRSQ
jgi:hypothetical protein